MFDEWMGAKGNANIKTEKVVGLREIYKRVLYKKVNTYGIMKLYMAIMFSIYNVSASLYTPSFILFIF